MYSIFADDLCIYNDRYALENRRVLNPKLILEDSAAGSLTLTLPPENVGFASIDRLSTDILVKKDGEDYWAGRVLSDDLDFWNNRAIVCEGALAFLNDSVQPPAKLDGVTIQAFLEHLLAVHNNQVGANRQITLGAVTVVNDDETAVYYTNFQPTMESINDLLEQFGGHFRIRYVNGQKILDYLTDYDEDKQDTESNTNTQIIQLGKNLLDFTRHWDSSEYATVIVPLGSKLEESAIEELDAYVTVEDVNGGSLYVQDPEAVATRGWIARTVSWDNVTDPSELLTNAHKYLSNIQFDNMELELSAVDLHYLDVNVEAVKLLDQIRVLSRPHGLDRLFLVSKMEIPLDQPEDTTFHLGNKTEVSLTSVSAQENTAVLRKIEEVPHTNSLLKQAKDNASALMNMATNGFITITKDNYGTQALYISSERDFEKSQELWKWDLHGLGYSRDGGLTYDLAMTQDGSIVADFVNTGTMNADVIRTGILRSPSIWTYSVPRGTRYYSRAMVNGNLQFVEKGVLDEPKEVRRLLHYGYFVKGGTAYYVKPIPTFKDNVEVAEVGNALRAAGTAYYRDAECTDMAGTLESETSVTVVKHGEIMVSPRTTYYVNKSSVGTSGYALENTPYYSDAGLTRNVGTTQTLEKITIPEGASYGVFYRYSSAVPYEVMGEAIEDLDISNFSNFYLNLMDGTMRMKKGSIRIGTMRDDGTGEEVTAFSVDEQGNLYARRGTFAGTIVGSELVGAKGTFDGDVTARNFYLFNGQSLVDALTKENGEPKISPDVLSLYGLKIYKKGTKTITFSVDDKGNVTINGGSIRFVGETGFMKIRYSTNKNAPIPDGWSETWDDSWNNNTTEVWEILSYGKESEDGPDIWTTPRLAQGKKGDKGDTADIPTYIRETVVGLGKIQAPIIQANVFSVYPMDDTDDNTGSFNIYGMYNDNQHHMFQIAYSAGDNPTVSITSPDGGTITFGSNRPWKSLIKFEGNVDFSQATITGLNTTARFG